MVKCNHILCLSLVLALLGCSDPPMEDGNDPVVTINFRDTAPPTSVSSTDGELEPGDNCATMREADRALQRVHLSANDPGGLAIVGIRIFGGGLRVDSIAPDTARIDITTPPGSTMMVATIPLPPTSGEVWTSSLAIVDLMPASDSVSVLAFARDRAGNYAETVPFDLRTENEAVICRE